MPNPPKSNPLKSNPLKSNPLKSNPPRSNPIDLDVLLRSPLTRRQLLGTGAAGVGLLVLSACGGAAAAGTTGTGGGSAASTGTASASAGTSGVAATSGSGTSGAGTTGTSSAAGSTTSSVPACTTNATPLAVSLAANPDLAKVGGGVLLTDNRYADPACGGNGLVVLQPSAGKFVALSSSCTHQCCSVEIQSKSLYCPCHGSAFDFTGKVTQGPARQALPTLQVCSDAENVYVQLA